VGRESSHKSIFMQLNSSICRSYRVRGSAELSVELRRKKAL
jgi:hypothetical protein